jgi:sec-independent protein translocase protein TatB
MFFDIGWPELMLIGVVALVVIGPKDLPRAMRIAGYWMRKARTLSREFHSSIDQMIREAELDEMREELKKATDFNIENEIRNTVDPTGELAESMKPPPVPDYFEEAEGPPAVAALPAPADTDEPELPFLAEQMPREPVPEPHMTDPDAAEPPAQAAHQPELPRP